MLKIRPYQKQNGKTGYELYNVDTGEAIARDDRYMELRKLMNQMAEPVAV